MLLFGVAAQAKDAQLQLSEQQTQAAVAAETDVRTQLRVCFVMLMLQYHVQVIGHSRTFTWTGKCDLVRLCRNNTKPCTKSSSQLSALQAT